VGGLKIASAGAAQALFSSAWVKRVFSNMPIPMNVWVKQSGKEMWVDEVNDLAAKTAKKLTEKGGKAGLKLLASPADQATAARTAPSGLVDEVPVEQMLLLQFSIVGW
jgi:hypothetical protein